MSMDPVHLQLPAAFIDEKGIHPYPPGAAAPVCHSSPLANSPAEARYSPPQHDAALTHHLYPQRQVPLSFTSAVQSFAQISPPPLNAAPSPHSYPQGQVFPQSSTPPVQSSVQASPPQPDTASFPRSYPQGQLPPQSFTPGPVQPYVEGVVPQQAPEPYSDAGAKNAESPYQPAASIPTSEPGFELSPDGDIVSHDPVLNSNGEALHRFILAHLNPPIIRLHISGSHSETEQRSTNGGKSETVTKTVKDFEFIIDLAESFVPGVADMYTLSDDEFAFRGEMRKERLIPAGDASAAEHGRHAARAATPAEKDRAVEWAQTRKSSGLPPWVTRGQLEQGQAGESPALGSSLSLRQWIDEFCASTKKLKQFNFNKVQYGMNLSAVQEAARQVVASTDYRGNVKVVFRITGGKIKIRAPSQMFQMMSNPIVKIILSGGKWDLCGAAYPLIMDPRNVPGRGPMRDGDWIKIWDRTIRLGVMNRIQSDRYIRRPVTGKSTVIVFG